MKLTLDGIRRDREAYEAAGYELPHFSYETIKENTLKHPVWIHFGAGNIFRAFQANVVQGLLNKNLMSTGLIVAEGYDYEIIEKSIRPHNNLTILATLCDTDKIEKTIIGSIMEALILDRKNTSDFCRLKEIFAAPSLQLASFTITEKGYTVTNPMAVDSYPGKVVSLLYTRYLNGKLPIAMVSMDNCANNGDKLHAMVNAFATAWCNAGLADEGFVSYVNDANLVSFPCSMIDKITPRPDPAIEALLREDGLEEADITVTSKNTYAAPFVNAEGPEYLVIEDVFPNGRPPLEKGGIIFTDRETVRRTEKMKVCTCLNPLHTALAIYGCLLGYTLISEEMKNPLLRRLVEILGYEEGLPVVTHPGILDPRKFMDEVVKVRIPNPFLPDTPQRIATDTSQKLAVRFGETLKSYDQAADMDVKNLRIIPLVFAGWLRYLMGVDDNGNPFSLSPDPLTDTLTPYVSGFSLSDAPKDLSVLDDLLRDEKIFGADLIALGLATRIKEYFQELSCGIGAVKATLERHVPTAPS